MFKERALLSLKRLGIGSLYVIGTLLGIFLLGFLFSLIPESSYETIDTVLSVILTVIILLMVMGLLVYFGNWLFFEPIKYRMRRKRAAKVMRNFFDDVEKIEEGEDDGKEDL